MTQACLTFHRKDRWQDWRQSGCRYDGQVAEVSLREGWLAGTLSLFQDDFLEAANIAEAGASQITFLDQKRIHGQLTAFTVASDQFFAPCASV